MRLSSHDILARIHSQNLITSETYPPDVRSVSVDLHLDAVFVTHVPGSHNVFDGEVKAYLKTLRPDRNTRFHLHPGGFVLGQTEECVTIPTDLVGWLDGRSSLARMGLAVHSTAHTIEPGFKGQIVLEIHNVGPHTLVLHPGTRIAAVSFELLTQNTCVQPSSFSRQNQPAGLL